MKTLAVFVVVALVPALAGASPSDLSEGLRLFEQLEYEAAQPRFAAAKLDESLSAEDRARAAVHLAIIQVSFGDQESARRNLSDAVSLDVEVELPMGASPALVEMLADARVNAPPPPEPVAMRHMGPAPGATPALVAAEIEGADADQVTRVVLHFRTANAPAWTRGDLGRAAPGRFEGALPVAPESGDIEYWLEALRNDDTVAATAGSAMLPMRFAATPAVEEEDEHWYQQWWLWAAVGAAVAGTVAATVYVVTRDDNGTNANPCDVAGQGCVEVTYQ